MWFIIGLIIFFITYYIHKHTYDYRKYNHKTKEYEYDIEDKLPSPLWVILIFFIISMVPILNILFFIVGAIIYFINISKEDVYFKSEGIIKKIFKLLTKEV